MTHQFIPVDSISRAKLQWEFLDLVCAKDADPSIAKRLVELVALGADPSPTHLYNGCYNATEMAIDAGNLPALRALKALGVDLEAPGQESADTPLQRAIAGSPDCVPLLVELGTTGPKTGKTALHTAARWGRIEWMPLLLSKAGLSIETRDDKGRTPLIDGWQSHMAIIVLLDCGADIDAADNEGSRLIHYVLWGAAEKQRASYSASTLPPEANTIVNLIGRGADLETPNNAGAIPRHLIEQHPALSQLPIFRAYMARRAAMDALQEVAEPPGSGAKP